MISQTNAWRRWLWCAVVLLSGSAAIAADRPRVLILDGQNNHDWRQTTDALRATLKQTGLFEVDVETAPERMTPGRLRAPKSDDKAVLATYAEAKEAYDALLKDAQQRQGEAFNGWSTDFTKYDTVVMNYYGRTFPEPMSKGLIEFVRGGGGLVLIHAANNAFRNWDEFNDMIGLGWRKGGFGKCLKVNPKSGEPFACCADKNSGHGSRHPFAVTVREKDHPIMRGVPMKWMHGRDELYHHMRGPAANLTILSSAYSDPK